MRENVKDETRVAAAAAAVAQAATTKNSKICSASCSCVHVIYYRRVYQIYVTIFPLEHKCIRNAMSGCLAGFVIDSLKHFLFRWLCSYLHGRQRISYARYPLS